MLSADRYINKQIAVESLSLGTVTRSSSRHAPLTSKVALHFTRENATGICVVYVRYTTHIPHISSEGKYTTHMLVVYPRRCHIPHIYLWYIWAGMQTSLISMPASVAVTYYTFTCGICTSVGRRALRPAPVCGQGIGSANDISAPPHRPHHPPLPDS